VSRQRYEVGSRHDRPGVRFDEQLATGDEQDDRNERDERQPAGATNANSLRLGVVLKTKATDKGFGAAKSC
jgi:hypothetical protein